VFKPKPGIQAIDPLAQFTLLNRDEPDRLPVVRGGVQSFQLAALDLSAD